MKLQFLVSDQTNPYLNLAVEGYLVEHAPADTVTLYLWRNFRTVVIGQNQNPFSEVNLDVLRADGGYLVRRRTGGGAVYHDDGNINFSFIAHKSLYDQQRQFEVLRRAVATYGLVTEVSGRNDVLVRVPDAEAAGGSAMRKFSGNAFSHGHSNYLHHGTILIRTCIDDLQRYLRPRPAKLRKHGVASVQSRVANLAELNPAITSEGICMPLREAFELIYGQQASVLDFRQLAAEPGVLALRDSFASEEWIYGHWGDFSMQREGQYEWGGVELDVRLEGNAISDVQIASDALDLAAIEEARRVLLGARADSRPVSANPVVADIVKLAFS